MVQDNKQIVRTFFSALGKSDANALGMLISDDATAIATRTSLLSGTRTRAEILAAAGMLGNMNRSGIHFESLELTAEENRVWCETESSSTLVNGQAYNNQYYYRFFLRNSQLFRIKEYCDTKLVDDRLGPLVRDTHSK